MLYKFLPFLLIIGVPAFAQPTAPKTYAVIVGISSYASKGIPALRFANKDAMAFSAYLQSGAGGKVPQENIKLLLNEEATTASVYNALSWLNEVSAKDDLVYFYFSGHGDMESETIFKLGFLLTYNTPRTNYINNAIRIEDLNNMANTLSLKNNAKVIIITDACHSGNIAGNNFRGSNLVGKSLSISKANEIRIASCRPDQLSMEDEAWGGGRGVFSFHLINGLIGFAAKQGEDVVTVQDLRYYLDSTFAKDEVLLKEKHQQNAVINGPDQFALAKKDVAEINLMLKAGSNTAVPIPAINDSLAEEPIEIVMDEFANWLKKSKIDTLYDFKRLDALPVNKITDAWLAMCKQKVGLYPLLLKDTIQLQKMVHRIDAMQQAMLADSLVRKQVERIFAVSIHDCAQSIINDYLEGDAAELERRRYYQAASSGYDVYPLMYSVALKLTDSSDYLYRILNINKYYFGGLALLLKIPLTDNPTPLIDEAMRLEQKALALEDQAAYIYNCLGVIHFYKGNFSMADSMYHKAMLLAPNWALPYSNLLALYTVQKKLEKANGMYIQGQQKANLLPDFYANTGLLREMEGNYLLAEEMQRKSIALNSRHYLPFERLGDIYTHTTNYALADSFYFEADVRKRGYHFKVFPYVRIAAPYVEPGIILDICDFDSLKVKDRDAAAYFTWGMYYFLRGDSAAAEKKWKELIQFDRTNPLAFYYLGTIQFGKQNWPEADILFRFALQNYIRREPYMAYVDSVIRLSGNNKDTLCFRENFIQSWFEKQNVHAFLGTVYRNWHHYTEAEIQFRYMIAQDPTDFAANKVLWQMLEDIGKYQDAEKLIQSYDAVSSKIANDELNAFYKRMIVRYPDEVEWYVKGGNFLYDIVVKNPTLYKGDRKRIFPDQQYPERVLLASNQLISTWHPQKVPGTAEEIAFEMPISQPYSDATLYFEKADSLLGDNPALSANINDKLGDLYLWQGVPEYAAKHYQVSVDMAASNAGVRLKLIDAYHITYQYSKALQNLEYLKQNKQLNMEKMLLLAVYDMHQSHFASADSLMQQVSAIYPYPLSKLLDLEARNYLLQKKASQAINAYTSLLQFNEPHAATMYSISRMFAIKGDKAKTMFWLKKAYDNGFNYQWVLNNDPLMSVVRKSNEWQSFMRSHVFLQYPEPTNTFPMKRATE